MHSHQQESFSDTTQSQRQSLRFPFILWLVLSFLFIPAALARVLPPGTYQDLVATEPLVLQKGAYVFVNLRMKVPGAGVGLDGRKASSLSLLGCRFEGGGMRGTGVLAAKDLTIRGCHFSGLENGVKIGSPKTKASRAIVNQLTITGNTFTNNLTGVYIDNGLHNLELKCNVFSQTTPIPTGNTHVGLLIGANASLFENRIGGNESNDYPEPPNSNYFPRMINGTTGAIEPFPNYFSVWNESASQISYYNYANEDLGNLYPQQSSGLPNYVNADPVSGISITRQNLENWCLEVPSTSTQPNWQSNGAVSFPLLKDCREMDPTELVTLKTAQLIPNNWVLACDGGPLDKIAFPIPRPAASSLVAEMVESLTKDKVYLGQSIPNPAQSQVTIPVLLSELRGSAVLEIFELATGKAIAQKIISGLGHQNVYFDVHTWAPGIYGYRIVLPEGKSPAPRKMVLVK